MIRLGRLAGFGIYQGDMEYWNWTSKEIPRQGKNSGAATIRRLDGVRMRDREGQRKAEQRKAERKKGINE